MKHTRSLIVNLVNDIRFIESQSHLSPGERRHVYECRQQIGAIFMDRHHLIFDMYGYPIGLKA